MSQCHTKIRIKEKYLFICPLFFRYTSCFDIDKNYLIKEMFIRKDNKKIQIMYAVWWKVFSLFYSKNNKTIINKASTFLMLQQKYQLKIYKIRGVIIFIKNILKETKSSFNVRNLYLKKLELIHNFIRFLINIFLLFQKYLNNILNFGHIFALYLFSCTYTFVFFHFKIQLEWQ